MTGNAVTVCHISQPADLDSARKTGLYSSASLGTEGFIHCCLKTQLAGVVERYYPDTAGLQLLLIDTARLKPELVYENTVGGEELFPHVYGQINLDAVVEVSELSETLESL